MGLVIPIIILRKMPWIRACGLDGGVHAADVFSRNDRDVGDSNMPRAPVDAVGLFGFPASAVAVLCGRRREGR